MLRRPSFLNIFLLIGLGSIGCGGAEFEIDYDSGLAAGGAGGSSSLRDSANEGGGAGTTGGIDAYVDMANDSTRADTAITDTAGGDRTDSATADAGDATRDDTLVDVATDGRDGGADTSDTAPFDSLFEASADTQQDGKTDTVLDVTLDVRTDTVFDVGCGEPSTYYQDGDGDGVGDDKTKVSSCQPPPSSGKWVTIGGDCRDDLNKVKPVITGDQSPPEYSDVGYADNMKPQGVSFDYDCSGNEEGDPLNDHGGEPDCTGLGCAGVGYIPVNPARSGTGINPYCGSTSVKRCTGLAGLCSSTIETAAPFRCR